MTDSFNTLLTSAQIEANFAEIAPALSDAEAVAEADRCLYCYDAPCTRACPTHIDVPAFIKKIASGNLQGSARVIFDANPAGATCARICPTSELCEGACVENLRVHKPIMIGRLQRYSTDYAVQSGRQLFAAGPPTGKSVGIIGAGPAGISAAVYLRRLGYDVAVYDKRPLPGGLDTYGMAEYKMTRQVSLNECAMAEQIGVKFKLGVTIGEDIVGETLKSNYDVLLLAAGLGSSRRLGIPGEDFAGVYDALDFIESVKTRRWESIPIGETVAVIGAGNTAIDAATQAKRLGAARVMIIYRRSERDMPAYLYEYALAKQDGIEFHWLTSPVAVIAGGNGKVRGLQCVKMEAAAPDATGRLGAVQVPGSEFMIEADMVIKALGQTSHASSLAQLFDVGCDVRGHFLVDPLTMQTSNPRVFAAGDCVNGGRDAVDAAQMGKLAASGIHKHLTGQAVNFSGSTVPQAEPVADAILGLVPESSRHPELSAQALGVKSYG